MTLWIDVTGTEKPGLFAVCVERAWVMHIRMAHDRPRSKQLSYLRDGRGPSDGIETELRRADRRWSPLRRGPCDRIVIKSA